MSNDKKRKFNIGACLILAICSAFATGIWVKRSHAAPELYMENTTFNLGVVPSGTDVRRLFQIANRGTAPLVVSQVEASCGCIKRRQMLRSNIIQPGASAPLEIVFSTPTTKKEIKESITLHTNDPQNLMRTVQLVAEVNPSFEINPALLNLGIIEESELPIKQTVSIKLGAEKNVGEDAVKVQNDSHSFSTNVRKVKYSTNSYSLDIEVPKNSPLGPIDGSLRLATDANNSQPYLVLGKIVGPVYSDPDEIFLQVEEDKKVTVQTLDIKSEGTAKIKSVTLESMSENLKDIVKAEVKKKPIGYAVICNFDVDVKSTLNSRGSMVLDVRLVSGETKKLIIPIAIDVISMKRAIDNDGANEKEK